MGEKFYLRCGKCSSALNRTDKAMTCPKCGGALDTIYDYGIIRETFSKEGLKNRPQSVWRYLELLPVDDSRQVVTIGEGGTRLLPADRLGKELGLHSLYIKDESRNPTGSFKDRKATLLLKTWLDMDYRSISAYLRAFPEQRIRIGLEKTPGHTTIRNHMLRIPEAYLRKLHLLIALANLAILNQNITRGTRHNSPMLKTLLHPIPKSSGDLCADSAYLSRRNCNLITRKGRTPIIKPKRNTTIRKHGSQPWRDMITLWLEDQTTFLKRYHQRSKAESVYSALKRCYGNHLASRRRTAQRRELHLRTLSCNIGIANLTTIRQENRQLPTALEHHCEGQKSAEKARQKYSCLLSVEQRLGIDSNFACTIASTQLVMAKT